MANYLDELAIAFSVKTNGVKKGINEAIGYISKYQKQMQALQEEIKLKFDKSGIKDLQNSIFELNKRKQELQGILKINVNSTEVNKLKNEIKNIDIKIKDIKIKDIKVNVDDKQAKEKLRALENKKLSLQKEINTKIKLDLENKEKLTKELNTITKDIQKLERNVHIKLEESGINKAKNELSSLNQELEETESINKNTEGSLLALGLTATAVFGAILIAVNKGKDAFIEYNSAMSGLKSQMEYAGQDIGKATQIMKETTKDGLISESDVAMSIKNLTLYGYSLEQANEIILRLKDSASYNRQAHYQLGEAVRVTTEGIKNENSILSDASGVTKNIAKMKEEYAKTLGKTADTLTQVEKAQAVYNGIMVETEAVIGNATTYSQELGGVMAENTAQAKKLAQAFGSALEPSLRDIAKISTQGKKAFSEFINENQGLTAGATATTIALIGLSTAFVSIKKGLPVLKSLITSINTAKNSAQGLAGAINLIGLAIAGLSIGIGVFTSIRTEMEKAKEEQKALNLEVEKFNSLMLEATTEKNISLKVSELDSLKQAKKDLQGMLEYYDKNATISLTTGISLEKNSFDSIFKKELNKTEDDLLSFKSALEKVGIKFNSLFNDMGELTVQTNIFDEKIKELTTDTESFAERFDFNIDLENITSVLATVDSLKASFDKLSQSQTLNSTELSKLINQYPLLAKYLADTGDYTLNNGQAIIEVMKQEIKINLEKMEVENARITQEIEFTKKSIELKENLLKAQNGDTAKKTIAEINNLKTALSEYEIQNIKAISSINILKSEMGNIDTNNLLSGLKVTQSEVNNLTQSYEKLSSGQRLNYEEMTNLIDTYPVLQKYIEQTGDITFKNGQLINETIASIISSHNQKRESLIENSKAELLVIQNEVETVTRLYEDEKRSILNLMKAREIAYKNNITSDINGPQPSDSYLKEIQGKLNSKKAKISLQIAELEKIGNIAKNVKIDIGKNVETGASAGKSAIKEQTTELEKQIQVFEKLKNTTELSANEQLNYLEKIKKEYAKTSQDYEKINALIYSQRKSVNEDWYRTEIDSIKNLNKQREDNTDFAQIINKYKGFIQEVKRVYNEYPQTVKNLESEINQLILQATKQRADKLLNIEKASLNERINALNEHITLMKKLNGLTFSGATISFTAEDESRLIKSNLDTVINALKDFEREKGNNSKSMTDSEKSYYEDLLKMQKDYTNKYIDSLVSYEKEKQNILENSLKEQQQRVEKLSKDHIQSVKDKYVKEIEIAKNTADEEISIYEQRIKEIDNILKQDSRNERDEGILDKIKRAEKQLEFEKDDANKYQLQQEIERLKKEYEKNKKEDSLNDEKDNLKEQINNLKESNTQRIKELEKMRDKEVENIEKSLENHKKALEDKLQKEIEVNTQATVNLSQELLKRLDQQNKINRKKENNLKQSMINEKNIIESSINSIINMLHNKVYHFATIGSSWGNALADNFNSVVSNISSSMGAGNIAGGVNSRSIEGVNNVYNFNQIVNSPMQSPSKARREMERMVRNARYL